MIWLELIRIIREKGEWRREKEIDVKREIGRAGKTGYLP
jgi:hypothetical protein